MKKIVKGKYKNTDIKKYISSLLIIFMIFLYISPYEIKALEFLESNVEDKEVKIQIVNSDEKLKTGALKKVQIIAHNNSKNNKECELVISLVDSNDKDINIVNCYEKLKGKESSTVTTYVNILPKSNKLKAYIKDKSNKIISNKIEMITTNPLIVDKIKSIGDLEVETNKGEKYILPSKVSALMSSGKVKELPIKWDKNVDTSEEGVYDFEGTVKDYDKKVNLTLIVKPVEKIKEVEDIKVSLMQNDIYNLPYKVMATMDTGEKREVEVQWDIDKVNTKEPGNKIYYGSIDGYEKKVKLIVDISSVDYDKPITFKNSELKEILKDELGIYDEDIYKKDLENITELSLAWALYGDTNIEDLRYLTNLKKLDLTMLNPKNINSLSNLTKLESLSLFSNGITDITPLKNLVNLKELNLGENKIKDIRALNDLTNLERLNLNGNNISNIIYLSKMVNLQSLDLSGNINIKDYSPTARFYNKLKNPNFKLELYKADSNKTIKDKILKGEKFKLPLAIKIDVNGKEENVFIKWDVDKVNTKLEGEQIFYGNIEGTKEQVIFKLLIDELKDTDIIKFPDKKLELGIRKAIDKPHGEICRGDIKYLKELNLGALGIEDLTGIENLTSLEKLSLWENKVSDISTISGLTKLKSLDLAANKIRILTPGIFSKLNRLEELVLDNNELTTIRDNAFDGLISLKNLHLESNNINNINEVYKLKKLEELFIRDNVTIKDITALRSLKKLKTFWAENNFINDISALENLTQLTWVKLDKNKITSLSSLKNLRNIQRLSIRKNKLKTLDGIENMHNLEWLEVEENQIENIEKIKDLTKLTILELKNNKIKNVDEIANLINLTQLYLNNNQIKDISSLNKLNKLKVLTLSNNQIKDYSPTKEYFDQLKRKDFNLN